MEYAVIRHGDMDSVVVFMKALDDGAVYFKNKAGTRQWIINLPTSNGRGGDIAFELRKQLRAKGLTAKADEINKAAQSLLSVIKHSDESSDDDEIIIDEGVEIIDAPYPEHGKAQIPRRCFIYDDEDGYPEGYEGYIEHHGILGMKWGVRRYQNKDGSLTAEGATHYAKKLAKKNEVIRAHAKNRQEYLNNSQGRVNELLKRYPKYAEENNIKDPQKQFENINSIYSKAHYKDSTASFWRNRSAESDLFMLQNEKKYDEYCNKLLKKFGNVGMDQIRSAYTNEMDAKSQKFLDEQKTLREVYLELQKEADDILNQYDVARDKKK